MGLRLILKSRVVCVCYRCAVAPDARIDFVCSGYLYRELVYGLTVVKALTESTVRQVRNLAACKLCGGLGGGNIRHILSCAALCFVADAKLNCTCAVLGTAAQIVAVRDGAVVISNHAAGINVGTFDRAGVVAVLHGAADHVTSDHAADAISGTSDRAGIVAALHGATVIRSNHAAHIAHTAYGNAAVAVEYIGLACDISHDAACGSVPTAYRGVYRSAYVQILDKIIAQVQVIIFDIPEKSGVLELLIGHFRAADGKTLDGIAFAVKVAAEYVLRTVDTDGDPLFSRKIDILRELDEFARKSTCRCR